MENEPLLDKALKSELSQRYLSAERHYHGLGHIEAMLALAAELRPILHDPEAVEAAIWFHDAVYDSRAKDNEARSAILAREKLAASTSAERLGRIAAMIEATATHHLPPSGNEGATRDAALFLDMDLAVLGADPAAFDAYEQGVRREYAWVAEPMWRAGRAAVLESFLARAHIYHSAEFRERFEAAARRNIGRSLAALRAG